MISIYQIKPKFQQLLKPILRALHKKSISANQITIAAIVLSFLIGLSFWKAESYPFLFLVVPVGLLIRMALNALDGMMARTYDQQSKLGEILNELGDVVSDVVIYFPLILYFQNDLYLIITFLCLGIINEFTGILGKVISNERRYDGPMGKSDRAFLISLLAILLFFQVDFSGFSMWIFITIDLLLLISSFKRISNTLKNV